MIEKLAEPFTIGETYTTTTDPFYEDKEVTQPIIIRRMSGSEESDKSVAPPQQGVGHQERGSPDEEPRVSLPSIFTSDDYREGRRASLPTLRHAPYPSPHVHTPSHLNSSHYYESSPSTTTTSNFSFGLSPYSEEYNHIVRPSSTGGLDGAPPIRHSSFSGPLPPSSNSMFAGSARISGHHPHDPSRRPMSAGIKSDWSFPTTDPSYMMPPSTNSYGAPPHHMIPAPNRSPPTVPSSSLVDRPQRKRGKLPKETTDFLKAWLHRHSDHPYPSEEEKKALCHATGLSMSQVSNWMINARRRILAPAHRAQSGPTTTTPYSANSRASLPGGLLDPLGVGPGAGPNLARRASMPADNLQIYHPMTLQSMPSTPNSHPNPGANDYLGSTRHMLGMPPASPPSSRGLTGPGGSYGGPGDYSPPPPQHRASLGQLYLPSQQHPPGSSSTPTSAASSSYLATPISGGSAGGNGTSPFNSGTFDSPVPDHGGQQLYAHSATNGDGSNPGSAYGTPHPQ